MKSILVHLDTSSRAEARLAWAQALARRHGAELTAMYAVMSSLMTTPVGADGSLVGTDLLVELDDERRRTARAQFDRLCGLAPMKWIDAGGEAPYGALLHQALYADLVVVGQPDPTDDRTHAMPFDLVPALAIESGRPLAVVPAAGRLASPVLRVMLAWKPTREAARAVRAALPLMRQADAVLLACAMDSERLLTGQGDAELEHCCGCRASRQRSTGTGCRPTIRARH